MYEDVVKELRNLLRSYKATDNGNCRQAKILASAADAIEELTDKNVGKWVKISPAGIYECSQCGQNVMTADIEAYKFCHGCGAKMEVPANV